MTLKIKFGLNVKKFFLSRAQKNFQKPKDALFFVRQSLQKNISKAVKYLKTHLLNNQSFQQMPWYIVIGSAGSGKTHLISASELPFLDTDVFVQFTPEGMATQGSVNWWFSPAAVLIDVPGYYLEETPIFTAGRVCWLELLRQIRLYRFRRPLNGIIITADIKDFNGDYSHFLVMLKTRLQEILYCFKQPLPVYIVINKTDQIQGFSEYYDDLGKNERDQCCGLTLPLPAKIKTAWTEIFSSNFDKFIHNLHQRALWRIHQEQDLKKRALILNFPHQLYSLKENLNQFIYTLSVLHPHLAFRSVYFTGRLTKLLLQENFYHNPVKKVIEKNFGVLLPPAVKLPYAPPKQQINFFIKNLFAQKIFPEARLVNDVLSKTRPRWENSLRWGIAGLAGILLLIAALTLSNQHQQQMQCLSNAANALSDYKILTLTYNIQRSSIEKLLPALNALQLALSSAAQANLPWLLRFQMHRKVPLPELTRNIYESELKNRFIPALRLQIAEQLKNDSSKDSAQLYGLLKTYLMLGDSRHYNKVFLSRWFDQNWQNALMQNKDFKKHLAYALENPPQDLAPDPALIQKVRALLNALPYALLSDAVLKNEFIKTSLTFKINNAAQSFTLPKSSRLILLTKQTLDSINASVNNALFSAVNGNWVLGNKISGNLSADDAANLKKRLTNAYLQDNKQAWQSFLAEINLKSFQSLDSLNLALQELISRRSPLIQLLNFIQAYYPYLSERGYADINANFNDALADLKNLEFYIYKISGSKNRGESALLFAQNIAAQKGPLKKIFLSLTNHAQKLPPPFNKWLIEISQNAQILIFQQASQYAWQQWEIQILPLCRGLLENHYPFDKKSSKEISLTDFERFFQKKGIFSQFFTLYLSPFVDISKAKWQWKEINGISFSQNENRLAQFERADIIQTLYFNQKNQLLTSFTLGLKSGKKLFYQWPLNTQSIKITSNTGAILLNITGDWSIFRLIDKADFINSYADGQKYALIFNSKNNNSYNKDNKKEKPNDQSNNNNNNNNNNNDDDDDDDKTKTIYVLNANLINPFIPGLMTAFHCP